MPLSSIRLISALDLATAVTWHTPHVPCPMFVGGGFDSQQLITDCCCHATEWKHNIGSSSCWQQSSQPQQPVLASLTGLSQHVLPVLAKVGMGQTSQTWQRRAPIWCTRISYSLSTFSTCQWAVWASWAITGTRSFSIMITSRALDWAGADVPNAVHLQVAGK